MANTEKTTCCGGHLGSIFPWSDSWLWEINPAGFHQQKAFGVKDTLWMKPKLVILVMLYVYHFFLSVFKCGSCSWKSEKLLWRICCSVQRYFTAFNAFSLPGSVLYLAINTHKHTVVICGAFTADVEAKRFVIACLRRKLNMGTYLGLHVQLRYLFVFFQFFVPWCIFFLW